MDYFTILCHSYPMGRRALKVDEASMACAQIFSQIRDSKEISMYRIKQDFGISNGRIDRLFRGEAPWSLDEFMAFCAYFGVLPSTTIKKIQALSAEPINLPTQAEVALVANKSKRKIGTETDEGFLGA